MRHSAGTWSGKTSEVPAFPVASLAETASRNELSERDTLSHRGFKRKPCPGIEPQGGTHFPVEAWDGRRVPESG